MVYNLLIYFHIRDFVCGSFGSHNGSQVKATFTNQDYHKSENLNNFVPKFTRSCQLPVIMLMWYIIVLEALMSITAPELIFESQFFCIPYYKYSFSELGVDILYFVILGTLLVFVICEALYSWQMLSWQFVKTDDWLAA